MTEKKLPPPDWYTADDPRALAIAGKVARALLGLPADPPEVRQARVAAWCIRLSARVAQIRPDFSAEQNEELVTGIGARALLIVEELERRAGRA